MRHIKFSRLSAVVVSVFMSLGTMTHADEIDPIGEENLGYLKVLEPNWDSRGRPSESGLTIQYKPKAANHWTQISFGQNLRLLKGEYCVRVQHKYRRSVCGVMVEPKKTTEYSLGFIYAKTDESLFEVNFGAAPRFIVSGGNVNHYTAHGTYSYGYRMSEGKPEEWPFSLPTQSHTITQGKVIDLDLTPKVDLRGSIKVERDAPKYPKPSNLYCRLHDVFLMDLHGRDRGEKVINNVPLREPHADDVVQTRRSNGAQFIDNWQKTYRSSQSSFIRSYRLIRYNVPVKLFPRGTSQKPWHFVVASDNQQIPVTLKPGESKTVRFKRIDVNDVLVTREDGSTYYRKGNYEVYRKAGASWEQIVIFDAGKSGSNCYPGRSRVVDKFATKSGINVVPGEYKVVVNYSTAEGAQRSEHFLDLR